VIDFGFDKIALIGAVALVVIGPEKLPRVARTMGHLLGKAQRYVAEVKAEVNRSIELEDLKRVKSEFEDAARHVERAVSDELQQTTREMSASRSAETGLTIDEPAGNDLQQGPHPPLPYSRPNKRWRLKRSAIPQWYKQRHRVRVKAQSGAARVARFRPPRAPL
jgi:sec-independent protein translocase protein TatB